MSASEAESAAPEKAAEPEIVTVRFGEGCLLRR